MQLTDSQIQELLTVKAMKPAKRKWSYRCKECCEVYNNEEHKQYVLIDTYDLDHNYNISLDDAHEGTLFCSTECASNKIKRKLTGYGN